MLSESVINSDATHKVDPPIKLFEVETGVGVKRISEVRVRFGFSMVFSSSVGVETGVEKFSEALDKELQLLEQEWYSE